MFTLISYLYTDGDNFKQSEEIQLQGVLTDEHIKAIEVKLHDQTFFIPGDLGLGIEELQPRSDSFPDEADHVFHSFVFERREVLDVAKQGVKVIPLEKFTAAFAAIPHSNAWQVSRACERLGI